MARFKRTISDVAHRIRFVSRQEYQSYLALTALCDVMLVPLHFGAGRSSYDAMAMGVPSVTLPTQLLRGCITAALYKMMEVNDCVVDSTQTYIELAVALGTNPGSRNEISQKILAACPVLYGNSVGVRELEQFFLSLRDS